ncbi:hypothetical protein cypCar_00018214 [Cyprinus carpio]|nr:hypothetical protein cypCar_00018214 [Cyprinus carpio]
MPRSGKRALRREELQLELACEWGSCQDTFDRMQEFCQHVEKHYEAAVDSETDLPDCEASFKGRFKLREHMRSHTQEKLVACPTCGGMFANNTKFFDHIRRQTSIEGIYCLMEFLLCSLIKVNHYKCPLCDMTCPSPSSLRNHIKFRHSNEKPYSCDYCEYSCKNLIDLRKHLDTHSSEPAYRCDFADFDYSTRSLYSIKNHYKRVHEVWKDMCKEHEDGFMHLQLIHYESVELTVQLMRERQGEGDSSESSQQNVQPGEELEESGPLGTMGGNIEAGIRKEGVNDCRTQEKTESVFLVLTAGTSSETDSTREKSVMRQLQDTGQQLGMEVV